MNISKLFCIVNLLFSMGFLEIKWVDIFDILLVSLLIFNIYKLMQGTLAVRVSGGFLVLYFLYLLVQATEMELFTAILHQFMEVGVIVAVILFQQEIKKFLLILGKSTDIQESTFLGGIFHRRKNSLEGNFSVAGILEAMKELGSTNTGALMVISRNATEMASYLETGDKLDSILSKRLLISIFNKYSPLHDGAVIIYDGRIQAARCILPVSENQSIPASMGLRHRAGIGMSEVTDSLILLVSEETGQLSVAQNGEIDSNLSLPEIRAKMNQYLKQE